MKTAIVLREHSYSGIFLNKKIKKCILTKYFGFYSCYKCRKQLKTRKNSQKRRDTQKQKINY